MFDLQDIHALDGMGFAKLRELDPRGLGDVLVDMPFQLPENFLLIGRAMSLTSGLCSSLDPSYNLWDSIEPYAAQLVRDEDGNVLRDVGKQALDIAQITWGLPKRADALVTQAEEGRLAVATPKLEKSVARAERTVRRLVWAVVFARLIVGGALVRPDDPGLGNVLMLAAVVPGLVALFGGRRG